MIGVALSILFALFGLGLWAGATHFALRALHQLIAPRPFQPVDLGTIAVLLTAGFVCWAIALIAALP